MLSAHHLVHARYPLLLTVFIPVKPGNPCVDTVLLLHLLQCNLDFPPLDGTPRPKSAAACFPGSSGILRAGAPFAAYPSPRSAQTRASSPAPLAVVNDGVGGVPGSLVLLVNRAAFGARADVFIPLPDRRVVDFDGVAVLG